VSNHRLQQMRPSCTVWYDQAPHGVLGGDVWWDEIMNAVSAADIFIYVLSNESVRSRYCQAEFAEARRLQKRIITIQARDRTKLTGELRDIQYVDMKNGVDDPEALVRLGGALDRQLSLVKKQRPLWYPRTPKPEDEEIPVRYADAPEVDTPTLRNPVPPVPDRPPKRPARGLWVLGAVIVALVIGALALAFSGLLGGDDDKNVGKETPRTQTAGVERSETPESTVTSTEAATLDIALVVQTLDAQATLDGATLNAQATVAARATNYAGGTQSAQNQTATAILWTFTPTPNITASIEAYRTQQAGDQTATATRWTATPTYTSSPTLTATVTPAPTHTPTATPDPLEAALMRAQNFSGGNDDWEPFVQTIDGVEMVLVPAGCFEMGSTQYDDEKPTAPRLF
jgi:hypothetical protein